MVAGSRDQPGFPQTPLWDPKAAIFTQIASSQQPVVCFVLQAVPEGGEPLLNSHPAQSPDSPVLRAPRQVPAAHAEHSGGPPGYCHCPAPQP